MQQGLTPHQAQASDESNMTTGKRLDSVGVENTETNRRDWRELLYTAPGLGQYISGAIMFEETLYQSGADGKPFVDTLQEQGIVPGIKVDTGLSVSISFTAWNLQIGFLGHQSTDKMVAAVCCSDEMRKQM